jgi:hypothetical protein
MVNAVGRSMRSRLSPVKHCQRGLLSARKGDIHQAAAQGRLATHLLRYVPLPLSPVRTVKILVGVR